MSRGLVRSRDHLPGSSPQFDQEVTSERHAEGRGALFADQGGF